MGGATLATGDFNGDGNVDITDLNILSDYYGTSAAGSAAIPEPAALVLVLAALATWRHRPRSTGWAHAG